MDISDVVLVLETRVSARGTFFESQKVSARLAFGIQVLRLALKFFIYMCELADLQCRLCANCYAYNLISLNVECDTTVTDII
jgi:hypothetical protein